MVRATFAGFSTALSAIQANQKRLDVVGQNLANMNTTGYTRQALETSSINYRTPVSNYMNGSEIIVGFGVSMDKVTQIRDPYLDVQYRNQMQKAGYTEGLQTSLDKLAKIFDESDFDGIHQAFLNVRSTLLNMQDPAKVNNPIYETELRTRMQALTNLMNDASRQIDEAERTEYIKLDGSSTTESGAIDTVNDLLMQIGTLNRQIKRNQVLGQQSLELMDERNVLLDELASYIPIEVTYYKDTMHDGINDDETVAKAEQYYLDSNGNPIAKKEWPDDLRVEMPYVDGDGITQRLTLVEGSEGVNEQNYGKLTINYLDENGIPYNSGDEPINSADYSKWLAAADYTNFTITVTESEKKIVNGAVTTTDPDDALILSKDDMENEAGETINQLTGGSIQASLDMLWKNGNGDLYGATDVNGATINGYEYYRQQLDLLAQSFADVMNTINIEGAKNIKNPEPDPAAGEWNLLFNKVSKDTDGITAANIGVNADWISYKIHVSIAGESGTDTVMNMLEAMNATYPYSSETSKLAELLKDSDIDLKGNSFADYMNHISTVLANDSYNNTYALKTNVTVLNAVQDSRDSMSGVSMNEEASNMMQFQAAYNAASRLITALDEVLDRLINSTGVCGR